VLTIHNLRFQGVYNIDTVKYWTNLPDYVFNKDALTQNWLDANMFKGGLNYCDAITTVSETYASEIQTQFFGEGLHEHLQYHSGKMRGIVNGIDVDQWDPAKDQLLAQPYDITNVLDRKRANKRALQEELGLVQDDGKMVIGLISRLTNQKGLDLVNRIVPQIMDDYTQVVVLGTGDAEYEDSFRYYENAYKGNFCANIMYDEGRAHHIYAGADALLVPSLFEPCGLTQLIAMRYGTVPIVRETGGLKDTVAPYNPETNDGNGFTFYAYNADELLAAINRAKTLFFTNRWCFDEMVQRDMDKDVSWENSAARYRQLYVDLTC
ncbi:MAG: glycogen synthase, partial [Lachnospiraceae bacterium]|nr:glycogen synthase [Lachnospiraceae bacterium]